MDLHLTDRVAVVTGGSGGIGSSICTQLAAEGARVIVAYHRNEAGARRVAEAITGAGGSAAPLQVDVRSGPSVDTAIRTAAEMCDGLDILINCAGAARFRPLGAYSEDDWSEVVDTNLKGTFLCCQAATPYLKQRGQGDIVNISSLAASTGSFEGGPYAASKAGVNSLTLSLALELAPFDIRVNAVAPGRIATPFRRTSSGPYFDFMLQQTPQRRMGDTSEIANAVLFLASRACPFITGQTLYADGGLHTVYLDHVEPDIGSKLAN